MYPGLNRRLLSVGRLAEHGLSVEFKRSSCGLLTAAQLLWEKCGQSVPARQHEEARFVQYSGADSEWELWHAQMGHPNKTY